MHCKACHHPQRAELDEQLMRGTKPVRHLAAEFGMTHPSLLRHQRHLPALLAKSDKAEAVSNASSLLVRVEELISDCRRIAASAESAKAWGGAASALREVGKCLELLARLRGELDAAKVQVQVNQLTVNAGNGGDPDHELASLMAAITDNFDPERLAYFRQLAGVNSRTIGGQAVLSASTQ